MINRKELKARAKAQLGNGLFTSRWLTALLVCLVYSAIFGIYRGDCMDDSVSHTEIVDFMVRHKKREKIYAFYTELCRELVRAGL